MITINGIVTEFHKAIIVPQTLFLCLLSGLQQGETKESALMIGKQTISRIKWVKYQYYWETILCTNISTIHSFYTWLALLLKIVGNMCDPSGLHVTGHRCLGYLKLKTKRLSLWCVIVIFISVQLYLFLTKLYNANICSVFQLFLDNVSYITGWGVGYECTAFVSVVSMYTNAINVGLFHLTQPANVMIGLQTGASWQLLKQSASSLMRKLNQINSLVAWFDWRGGLWCLP